MEERYKYEHNFAQLEIAQQKCGFMKRLTEMEKVISRLKTEKQAMESKLDA